jgi:hypothetical protein
LKEVATFIPKERPLAIEKFDSFRSNQLLERPASSEPSALLECFDIMPIFMRLDILEIRVADPRFPVPAEHRVNSLWEFGATALIDTTGVDPDII